MNAIIGFPDELKTRVKLRSEFIRLSFLQVMMPLRPIHPSTPVPCVSPSILGASCPLPAPTTATTPPATSGGVPPLPSSRWFTPSPATSLQVLEALNKERHVEVVRQVLLPLPSGCLRYLWVLPPLPSGCFCPSPPLWVPLRVPSPPL